MLKLYNTETRSVGPFSSIEPGKVGMYTCGPTVYNFAHIGNLRTYVFEDLLKRVLGRRGFSVRHVMNITDVGHLTDDGDTGEDKMVVGAAREKKSVWDLAGFYTDVFRSDLAKLGIREPEVWCKATEHIPEQVAMVGVLEKKGFTYALEDGVYFDTAKFPAYGRMAGLDLAGQQEGARVEKRSGKRNAADFCLWKLTPAGVKRLMEWDSPWGRGFPGWHLECSAMALKYLGERIDIHCGGIDHVRVHHTNEIAQTEAATGKKWVNWWMHGEFLLMEEGKMSKSADNFLTLDGLVAKGYDSMAYRLLLMSAHYRKAMVFSFEALDGAQKAYERLRLRAGELPDAGGADVDRENLALFDAALDDDLNMPKAVSQMWMMLQDGKISPEVKAATLKNMDEVLGLEPMRAAPERDDSDLEARILGLIAERNKARKNKDFRRSDEIRKELASGGIQLKDGPEGTTWTRQRG